MGYHSAVAKSEQLRTTPEAHIYGVVLYIYANTMQNGCRNKHFFLVIVVTIVYLQWVNQSYSQRVV